MLEDRPLLIPLLGLAAGLTCSDVYNFFLPVSAVVAAFCCLLLACLLSSRIPLALVSLLFFFVWGLFALTPWKTPGTGMAITELAGPAKVTIEGVVAGRPTVTPDGSRFVLQCESVTGDGHTTPVSNKLLVLVSTGSIQFQRGDRVRLQSRIIIPHKLGLPGEFDYPRFLKYQEIAGLGRVASGDEIVLIKGVAKDSLLRRFDVVATHLAGFIHRSVSDHNAAAVLCALLLGDQKEIPVDLAQAYTRAGVNHILSISGFHIAIIAFFIVQLCLLVTTRSEVLALRFNLRCAALLLAVPAMLGYLFITGAAPATSRSVIMLMLVAVALYVERETDPVNSLLIAGLLLLSLNPPSLFDLSFQLSFLSLWGIIVLVPPLINFFGRIPSGWQRGLLQFLVTSSIASLATALPVLYVFNQASLNGVLTNFLIVPLLGYGAVLLGFCALPLAYFSQPVSSWLLWGAGKVVVISNQLILYFAKLPVLQFYGISPFDIAAFLGIMLTVSFIYKRHLRTTLCAVLPLFAIVAHVASPPASDGRLHVNMLSVGQAESLLVRLPSGKTMLIDGGGYLHDTGKDFGERTLAPALHKMKVERIDRLIMTHSHPDHVGGLPYVASVFPVGEFWEPASGGEGEQYRQLRQNLLANRVPVRQLVAGDTLDLGEGVKVLIFSPGRPQKRSEAVDEMGMNEESLVFKLCYGNFSVLFTADAGFSAEERMLSAGSDLRATVLKVGHHGSRFSTSEDFLDRVKPELALISAGLNNSFRLPAPATLETLQSRRIPIYRTDLDGTIEVVSDGRNWQVHTRFKARH